MATNMQVRAFLNAVAMKKFNKKYKSLSSRRMTIVRKKAASLAFRKRR